LLHTLKNQTLELFCLTYNSFLLESHGRVFFTQIASLPSAGQSCAHGKLCLTLELRTSLPLPSPASASDALMLFFSSPSCSHVIFVWVYIIIIISVPSPISIAPLHTWHSGCDLLRSVMFSFLAKQSVCVYNSTRAKQRTTML